MNQSRLSSFYEAWINVAIGFGINFFFNLVILNGIMGLGVSLVQNLWIGVMFTVVSVARSYLIRRYFNAKLHRMAMHLAGATEPVPEPVATPVAKPRRKRTTAAERLAIATAQMAHDMEKQHG